MSDFYYKIDGHTLHLTTDNSAILVDQEPFSIDWPWTGDVGITKVVFYGPIQLPPDSSCLFANLRNLTAVMGLDKLDTSKVVSIWSMFDHCESLDEIPGIDHWDVSGVVDMSHAFSSCRHLKHLNLSKWDTSNANHAASMFLNCPSLQSVTTADQRIIAELPDGVHFEAPTTQEPTMADEASRAVSIEGGPSEPKPQTR